MLGTIILIIGAVPAIVVLCLMVVNIVRDSILSSKSNADREVDEMVELLKQYEQKVDEEKPKRQTRRRRKRNKNKEKK